MPLFANVDASQILAVRVQLFLPLRRLVVPAPRAVELYEPVEGLGNAGRRDRGGRARLTGFDALVPSQKLRFSGNVLLLGEQAAAEYRLGVEGFPFVGFQVLADGQALVQDGLRG